MELPNISAGRLFEMLERLPLYHGALTARATIEAQQQDGALPSGATVGARSGSGSPMPSSPGGSPGERTEWVESTGRNLTGHPAFAGLVEHVKV